MKRKNIIIASLAVLLLLLVSSPAMALSWKNGMEQYSESITKEEFGGIWSFDAENETLTLNNISINTDWSYILQMNNEVKTLILIGENSIITSDGVPINYWGDKLTITGSGSLYANGSSFGICISNNKSLTIDGTTVHAVCDRDSAIRAHAGVIEITNGANVTAECVVSSRSGALMTGLSVIRNGSTLNAIVMQTGNTFYDYSEDYYPIYNETPLTIEDTSKMYLTSVKPFNYDGEASLRADSLNFSFPGGANNYMTCAIGPSNCEHSFDVKESQLTDGKYMLSVQGKKLPASKVSHPLSLWVSNGDGTHTRKCTLNEAHPKETRPCHGGKATTQTPAICVDCGTEYGELLPPDGTEIPKTGDSANLILWTALMATSIIGMLLMRRKKEA